MDSDLEKRAAAGHAPSQLALGLTLQERGKHQLARSWFARAAPAGNIAALRHMGVSLLTRPPVNGEQGFAMIRAAADRGDGEAAHLCGLLATQNIQLPDRWAIARQCSEEAAKNDFPLAHDELSFLRGKDGYLEQLATALPVNWISQNPRIGVVENCLTPEACDWFIARAKPRLAPATIYDRVEGVGVPDKTRSNSAVPFDLTEADLILMALHARILGIVETPNMELEATNVLHYAPSESFEPHFDFLDPATQGHARDIELRGQRVATFLIYLNDDYEGGETEFLELGIKHKGKKGDALLFWNVDE